MVKGRERKTGYEKAPRPILIAASPKNRPAESARSIGVIVVSARSDDPVSPLPSGKWLERTFVHETRRGSYAPQYWTFDRSRRDPETCHWTR